MWSSRCLSSWRLSALRNQRLFYNLLFRAASETLLEIAADPRHLGARIGVLLCCTPGRRTWDIIPTCTVSFPPADWRSTAPAGFDQGVTSFCQCAWLSPRVPRQAACLPEAELSPQRTLLSPARCSALSPPRAFNSLLHTLRSKEWVVYSKPPFGGPEHVLKYPWPATPTVLPSPTGGLLGLDNGQVRFRWRDSRHNNRSGVMALDASEFIRRFLLHVLPAGFVKIRHFGLLANRNRSQALALCRIHLHATTPDICTLLTEPAEVRTEPILSQCKKWHPARGRKTATGWNGQLPRTARLRAVRLILRKTLPTRIPTRSLASTGVHPANATSWLESVPHDLDACRSPAMHTAGAPLNDPLSSTSSLFVPIQPH